VEVYVAHDDDRRVGGDVVEQVSELVEERGRRCDRTGSMNDDEYLVDNKPDLSAEPCRNTAMCSNVVYCVVLTSRA